MPIIIEREQCRVGFKFITIPQVVFVGPDRSGTYTFESSYPIQSLDPQQQEDLVDWLPDTIESEGKVTIELDYNQTGPENREQILFIKGLERFRHKVYLSPDGNGEAVGLKPKPQTIPHMLEVHGFEVIRPTGVYRRERVYNNGRGKEVIGWIRREEHDLRMGYERK